MSNNGYFGDVNEDQGFDLDPKCIDENELVASNETEDFDAFNEDTFGGAVLEDFGEDWEAQHDQLIALEDTEKSSPSASPGNKTLTKFEDYDKIDNGKFSMTSNNERTQSLLNPIQNPMASNFNNNFLKNDLFQNMDQNSVQKMQMLQQQQNLVLQQQLQKQKIQNQMNQSQLSSNPINKNINQPNLNEIQLKLIQQLQIQQQLQLQMNQQLKLQQQSAQVGNSQAKQQQQQLVQQIQYQQQLNANAILSLINSRNTILQQQQQQQQQINNQLNRKTPVNFDLTANNQNQLMSNQEKENYIQNKLAEMHLSSDKSSVIGNQQLQQQKLATAQVNPLQMISAFQQQQQQPSQLPEMPKPHMTKSLPNAKTLEEIENELLNQSSSRQNQSQLNQDSNDTRLNQQLLIQQQQQQQQQLELLKMLPLLNMIQNQSQSNINPNDLQNLIQLQQQKQLLQALALQQQNSQQQQHQQQQQQFLQQQMANNQNQGFSSNLNINNLLPQNFQFMNPQQKQQVIASLAQRNLQLQPTSSQLPLNQDPNTSTNLNNINQNMLSNYMEQMKKSNQRIPLGNVNQQYQNELNQANNMKQKNDHLKLGDKLAGMMTDKEKNWVVNVQMMQLQIDDPYAYDFYYTAWMLKKNAKQNGNLENGSNSMSDNNGLKTSVLIQGNNQKHDPKNYRPLIFENSLGKVTMSNFHHPRALIDINQKSSDNYCQQSTSQLISHIDQITEHDEPKDKKNICNILLEIEKMYQVFLTIDEIEHKILKEPEETRGNLFSERRIKVDNLASMMCSENFPHYLFVSKGKRLLGKCLPSFNLHQTKQILGYFMQYIYIISKNNISLDEIYTQISYAIDTQKFNDLIQIVQQFVLLYSRQSNQIYKTIFLNKFGLTYLLKFFSKSELINQDDFDNEVKSIWSSFLNLVLNGLLLIDEDDLNNGITNSKGSKWNVYETYQLNFNTILKNFDVNMDLWTKNEGKLKELFTQFADDEQIF